jgi:DUF1680 family protein
MLLGVAGGAAAGDLTDRYQLTLERVLSAGTPAFSEDLILKDVIPEHVRRFTEYSGDVSGRYVGALAAAALDRNAPFSKLDQLVPKIIGLQKPDGFFGEAFHYTQLKPNDMALLWGNGRLLIGLLEYYRHNPQPEVLAAARRLGDFLVKIGPTLNSDEVRRQFQSGQFASGYICWTQNVEPFAELFRLTKDSRYRQMAEAIADRTERRPSEHSHGFLSSVRGIVDLYRVTGERKYLDRAEREWHGVIESGNLLLPGSIPEAWRPDIVRTEGCAEADWVRLSLALWQLTGKSEYLEKAELSLFNELSMNQFTTGDFGHRLIANTGVAGHNFGRAWWCCTLHGLRCFPDVLSSAFRLSDGVLSYDLPVDGRARGEGLAVSADSALGRDGSVRLQITSADGKTRTLAIRQPSWARDMEISVNGRKLDAPNRNGYRQLTRGWKAGDRVLVKYAMTTRTVRDPQSKRVALFHGPWLLGIDEAMNPYYFDEPSNENRLRLAAPAADGAVALDRAPVTGAVKFAVPAARFTVTYLQGGYPMTPGKAVLRPVAEQTGTSTTTWEFWFRTERD